MQRKINIGDRYGRLTVLSVTEKRKNSKIVWKCRCDCGKITYVNTSYLNTGDTQSCGCIKREQNEVNLREQYDNKKVDDVAIHLFDDKARKDSSTGYRGVSKYYTRVSKELRYRAWITVKGKQYYKSGFKTAEEAYYEGRLELERKHLPPTD